jgi:Histone acetyltransferase subunit NuA4
MAASPQRQAESQADSGQSITLAQVKDEEAQLSALIAKKRAIEKSLSAIESSLFAVEGTYLEESHYGNVVKGYEG